MTERPWKPGTGQRIERLYAWVATEPDGGEGIVGAQIPGVPGWTPLIGADRARIESYREIATAVAQESGLRVALKMFSNVETLEVLGP